MYIGIKFVMTLPGTYAGMTKGEGWKRWYIIIFNIGLEIEKYKQYTGCYHLRINNIFLYLSLFFLIFTPLHFYLVTSFFLTHFFPHYFYIYDSIIVIYMYHINTHTS